MVRKRPNSPEDPMKPDKKCWKLINPKTGSKAHYYSMLSPEQQSQRPAWEPIVQRSAWKIETNPHLEEAALKSLQRQGCQNPVRHYFEDHVCQIPARRLQCLREVRQWQQSRPIILTMAQKLPKELVIQVLEYVVLSTQPVFNFRDDDSLQNTAAELIGSSTVKNGLLPLTEQALLEQSILNLQVGFHRTGNGRIAELSPALTRVPHPVRNAQVALNFEIPIGRQKYPAILYTATSGVASILSQLPGLRSLHYLLNIELTRPPWDHVPSALNVTCRKGFSGTSRFRTAIEELLEATKVARPELDVYLELRYIYEGTWRGAFHSMPATFEVAMGDQTPEATVKSADAKWEHCRFSLG